MNPELQTLVDRLELLERQGRTSKLVALISLAVAAAAIAVAFLQPNAAPDRARYSVIETNRLLLRDLNGSIAGGMESQPDGSLRLVLGGRGTSSAHLVIPRGGAPQLTLRSPEGQVRAGIDASDRPSLWLSNDGRFSQVALGTTPMGQGEIWARDGEGKPRFHAP